MRTPNYFKRDGSVLSWGYFDVNAEIIELRKIIDGNYMYISSLENEIKENNLIIRLFEESTDGDSPDLEKIAEIKDKHLAWRLSCVDFNDFE